MRDGEDSQQTKRHGKGGPPWVMIVLTVIIAVSAAVSAAAVLRQGSMMKDQLNVMERTLNHAERSSTIQLQAYVQVEPGVIVNFANDGSPPEAYVRVVNAGVTPATIIRQDFRAVVLPPPITKEQITFGEGDREPGQATMRANAEYVVHRRFRDGDKLFEESEASFLAIRGDEGDPLHLYVFGTIKYRDVFDEMRSTKFCFSYWGNHQDDPNIIPGEGYFGRQARPCEIHNENK